MSSANEKGEKERVKKRAHFMPNNTYHTISVYVIRTFVICLILYEIIHAIATANVSGSAVWEVLSPFIIAFLIAYFVNPIANRLDYLLLLLSRKLYKKTPPSSVRKARKIVSLILAYVIIVGLIVLFCVIAIPKIISSLTRLVQQIPQLYDMIMKGLSSLQESYPNVDFDYIESQISDAIPKVLGSVQDFMTSLLPKLYDIGKSIVQWVVNIILAFIISCYLVTSKKHLKTGIKRFCYALFRPKSAESIVYTLHQCSDIFSRFLIGKAIDSLIIGLICLAAMRILHLEYATLISLVVGVTNMIPYFGPVVGGIIGILILLIVSPKQALIFLVLVFLLQQFDGGVLGPKILGDSTGLPPIWIIFAIIVGGAAGGVIGMFLGVPITAVLVYLLNNYLDYRLYKRGMASDLSNLKTDSEKKSENIFIRGSEKIKDSGDFRHFNYNSSSDFKDPDKEKCPPWQRLRRRRKAADETEQDEGGNAAGRDEPKPDKTEQTENSNAAGCDEPKPDKAEQKEDPSDSE